MLIGNNTEKKFIQDKKDRVKFERKLIKETKTERRYCIRESKKLLKRYSKFRNFGYNIYEDFEYLGTNIQYFHIVDNLKDLSKMKNDLEKCFNIEYRRELALFNGNNVQEEL